MGIFGNRNRPRATLDILVGTSHTVEVLLQLRRSDWDWHQSNEQAIREEILELLEQSILPRMFRDEIEQFHMKRNPQIFPSDSLVGIKNSTTGKKQSGKARVKSRNGGKSATTTAVTKPNADASSDTINVEKDVYFAFGELVQLAYRKQPLPPYKRGGRTLFFQGDEAQGGYHDRPKLSHRLLVWCSKLDPENKTNPDPENVDFFRPEMIPIASLFREPKELSPDEEG